MASSTRSALNATQFDALKGRQNLTTDQQVQRLDRGRDQLRSQDPHGWPIGTGNPILADPRVREAIALAINRHELVSKVLDGKGVVGAGYLPPASPSGCGTPPRASRYYDPAKANQILDAAGYKKGADGIRVDPKTGKPLTSVWGSTPTRDRRPDRALPQGVAEGVGIGCRSSR